MNQEEIKTDRVKEAIDKLHSDWNGIGLPPSKSECAEEANMTEKTFMKYAKSLEKNNSISIEKVEEGGKKRIAPPDFNWNKLRTAKAEEIVRKFEEELRKEIEYDTIIVDDEYKTVPVSLKSLARKWSEREFDDIPERVARKVGMKSTFEEFEKIFYSFDQEIAKKVLLEVANVPRVKRKINRIFND